MSGSNDPHGTQSEDHEDPETHRRAQRPDRIPNPRELRWPAVEALRTLGGRASTGQISDRVADALGLTETQRSRRHESGANVFLNSLGWAQTELKQRGLLTYPSQGVRELTEAGWTVTEDQTTKMAVPDPSATQGPPTRDGQQTGESADAPTAWVIRAGRDGERYDDTIEHGLAGVSFGLFLDLRTVSSRDELKDALRSHHREAGDRTISNQAGQLWRMRTDVSAGDLVIMPHKTEPHVALGTVTREYAYAGDDPDSVWPHVVSVDWSDRKLPWTAIGEDLRSSLNAQQSLFQIERHDGAWRFQQMLETGQDPGPRAGTDLAALVEDFLAESGYPTDKHLEQEQLREQWAEKLAPDNIANLSRQELTAVASHGTWYAGIYVYRHAQGVMKWIQSLDGYEYAGMLDHIRYLCWSDDEPWRRYDQLTDASSSRKTPGLGHSTTSRLLAITHPHDFLAIGVQGGKWGRAAMLRRLGLPRPAGSSYGQRVMDADRRLREHLEPHFGDDTLGMGAFVGWLLIQKPPVAEVTEDPIDPGELEELADELLVDAEFVKDIVSLLEDKGQVILYGPPGTGKTYLARELAEALAPDESCRALVQFHPSTSYEDFFEGYRPAGTGDDGGIRFELTPGPLARIAERASEAPDEQHVMIIDEINRGNLPRVLGELLFLLEYRGESARTLYRPDEPFALPDNLWFIGTMNTADRSIALVDAALRRRFHFVPFFPDREPMVGLLGRWLQRQDQPDWIGRLVDAVNDELKAALEGSHLLLGPSHFMKEYGSSPDEQRDRLRRIWEYNIEPFIEDQFFGNPQQIESFRFKAVWNRHGPATKSVVDADDVDDVESADGSEGEQAAADGAAALDA